MTVKCYYCGYHTTRQGFCQTCICWSQINSDGEVYKVEMIIILKGTKQYHIESYVKGNKTFITDHRRKDVLTLDGLPFTPNNVKQKLSLYLIFS